MDADTKAKLKAHARAIAEILYDETDPAEVTTLADIEEAVRHHLIEHINPEIGNFLSKQVVPRTEDAIDTSPASSGN